MSNIYNLEPPTSGKVILNTSVGEIEIELWCKECPLTCRNFIQLCMEGYYDDTIFHRVVKGFIVQGGDPSGTGTGGESIYDGPFVDEFHSRLKYNRRGLLGMANSGDKNDNRSQFFFTLDKTPELQRKNTLFGKIEGTTIFNMLRIGEGEVEGPDFDQPVDPVKLISTKIILNPFEDMLPRNKILPTLSSSTEKPKKKKKRNIALLSFAEEVVEDIYNDSIKGGMKSSHDLLDNDPTLSKDIIKHDKKMESKKDEKIKPEIKKEPKVEGKIEKKEMPKPISSIQAKKEETQKEIELLKQDILKLKKPKNDKKKLEESSIKTKKLSGKELLAEQMAKYKNKNKLSGKEKEKEAELTYNKLISFQSKLHSIKPDSLIEKEDSSAPCKLHTLKNCKSCVQVEFGHVLDRKDDDRDWMKHNLKFDNENKVGGDRLEDYTVIDPRKLAAGPIMDQKVKGKDKKIR